MRREDRKQENTVESAGGTDKEADGIERNVSAKERGNIMREKWRE